MSEHSRKQSADGRLSAPFLLLMLYIITFFIGIIPRQNNFHASLGQERTLCFKPDHHIIMCITWSIRIVLLLSYHTVHGKVIVLGLKIHGM